MPCPESKQRYGQVYCRYRREEGIGRADAAAAEADKHTIPRKQQRCYRSAVLELADMGPTPEQALAETEWRTALAQAISHLRESLRIVVLLRGLEGLTSAETARRLGLTVSAVKARTFHARRCLRHNFERRYKAACRGFLIGTQNKE